MAKVTYVFGDVLTGAVIDEIPLQGVSMTRGFGQGEFRGSFQLDQTGKSNSDLIAATEQGRSYVICERDNQPIWGGFVWTRTYQSQAKIFQLYCRAFEHYPEYRFVRSDILQTDVEQRNIFRTLWSTMMADPNSLQIDLPASFSTIITKSLDIKAFEFKTYREVMDTITNGDDGFDWTIDVARVGGAYTRTLRIGYPTLGSVESVVFDYPGSVLNYWQNGSMAQHGTNIFGLGSGEGSTMVTQEVIHSDLISSRFPRYDTSISFKGISDPTQLTSLTTQAAIIRKAGVPVITAEVKGNLEPVFGGYGLGDAAKVYFVDPSHPEPSTQLFTSRILGWEYYPSSDDHVEFARLAFEGED
jgi:hypothetical protein